MLTECKIFYYMFMYTYIHYVLNYSLYSILFIITTVYNCILSTVYLNKIVLTYQLVKNVLNYCPYITVHVMCADIS